MQLFSAIIFFVVSMLGKLVWPKNWHEAMACNSDIANYVAKSVENCVLNY